MHDFKSATWCRCLSLGGLSSLLLWLAYFPANLGWLGWIGLVPFLALVRIETTNRRRYWSGWLSGFAFFLAAISWMRVANPMMAVAWVVLSFMCSAFVPVAMYLLRRFDARTSLRFTITVPMVMIALELVRSRIFGGFPWYLLGHTQHEFISLIQIADIGGVAAITGLLAAVNGLIAEKITRPTRPIRNQLITIVIVIVAYLIYGFYRLSHDAFPAGPRIALLQGNLTQDLLNATMDDDDGPVKTILEHYIQLMESAAATHPDLIVWPETMFSPGYAVPAPGFDESELGQWRRLVEVCMKDIASVGKNWRIPVLLGAVGHDFTPAGRRNKFNTAIFVAPTGIVMARYDKMHRVPFGEYVPLFDYFPWLAYLNPYEGREYSITPGEEFTRFPITVDGRTYRFGVVICYEDSDAPLTSNYVTGNDKVDFLVNISNDGWFKCSQEHEQHLAISRFRAIECRRSLVRAVNMGISAFIDSDGRIIQIPGKTWSESKGQPAVLTDRVPIDHRFSFFANVGDWMGFGAVFLTCGLWIFTFRARN